DLPGASRRRLGPYQGPSSPRYTSTQYTSVAQWTSAHAVRSDSAKPGASSGGSSGGSRRVTVTHIASVEGGGLNADRGTEAPRSTCHHGTHDAERSDVAGTAVRLIATCD